MACHYWRIGAPHLQVAPTPEEAPRRFSRRKRTRGPVVLDVASDERGECKCVGRQRPGVSNNGSVSPVIVTSIAADAEHSEGVDEITANPGVVAERRTTDVHLEFVRIARLGDYLYRRIPVTEIRPVRNYRID